MTKPPAREAPGQEVHGGRPDEACHEQVGGAVVELERGPDLLHHAVVHHDDLVGHGHGLDLVVGDVDRGGLQPLVQGLDLRPHRDAQLGVEVRQRLVEQEHLRVAHDRAAHGDPLALPARELLGVAVEQRRQARGSPPPALTLAEISAFGARRSLSEKAMFSATLICG